MKTLTTTLLLASLVSPFALAGENIGNNEVELAINATLNANDGLSLEEKIYKLWQEAEGSIPQFDIGPCYSGLSVQAKNSISNAQVCVLNDPVIKADAPTGELIIWPERTYGLYSSHYNYYTEGLSSTVGSGKLNIFQRRPIQLYDKITYEARVENGSLSIEAADYSRAALKLRALSDNVLVGIVPQVTDSDGVPGYCYAAVPIKVTLPKKKKKDPTVTKVIGYEPPTHKVPGVCEVLLFNVLHK